ncbi:hypothetical protein WJ970_12980 [Achromobacter xylosoxidans]
MLDEVGLVQLALLQVDEAGAGLAGADGGRGLLVDAVAVAGRTQHRALRQGGQVELEHVRQRTQAVEAVFALAVGDGEGAVFQVQAHAGDADFAGFLVLDAIAVAVQRDLANDEGLFREHAADHFHPRRGFVRPQRAAGGAGAVDAVALQGADVHAHAIGQAQRFLVGQAQRRQLEAHRQPALAVGSEQRFDGAGAGGGDDPRRALLVDEAGGGQVLEGRAGQQPARLVVQFERVVHEVHRFDDALGRALAQQQALGRGLVQRQVVVGHGPAAGRYRELGVVGGGLARLRRGGLRLHRQRGRAGGQDQGLRLRRQRRGRRHIATRAG